MAGLAELVGGARVDNLTIKLNPDRADAATIRQFAGQLDPEALPAP